MKDISDCPNTFSNSLIGLKTSKNTLIEGNQANQIFLGLDFDVHLLIGGHIKIGFNVMLNG